MGPGGNNIPLGNLLISSGSLRHCIATGLEAYSVPARPIIKWLTTLAKKLMIDIISIALKFNYLGVFNAWWIPTCTKIDNLHSQFGMLTIRPPWELVWVTLPIAFSTPLLENWIFIMSLSFLPVYLYYLHSYCELPWYLKQYSCWWIHNVHNNQMIVLQGNFICGLVSDHFILLQERKQDYN